MTIADYRILAEDFQVTSIDSYSPEIWSPEEIIERDTESYNVQEPPSDDVKQEILEVVEEAKEQAEEGSKFFNGPLVRLQNFNVKNGALNLELQNTNYFSHVGTRKKPGLSKEERADPLSVGAYLITSDGYIVLGEKSGLNEIGSGEYQLAGAGFIEDLEKQYERSLNAQSFSPIHRELEEEVNLDRTQLTGFEPSALVGAVHRQPMLIYDTETVLESDEVVDEWIDIPEDEREFSGLAFIPEEDRKALEGEVEALMTDPDEASALSREEYDGDLRPHAEGALDALS